MVTVYFELPDDKIISTSKYFNNSYTDDWLDDWAKKVIKEIDDSVISNANSCGDNCASLLAELSQKKDFSIYLSYPMKFSDLIFDMKIARTGSVCHTAAEFEKEHLKWRQRDREDHVLSEKTVISQNMDRPRIC